MTFRPPFARARTLAFSSRFNLPSTESAPEAPPAPVTAPTPVVASDSPPVVIQYSTPVVPAIVVAAPPVAEVPAAPEPEPAPEPTSSVEEAAKVYDDGNNTTVFDDLAKVRRRGSPRTMSDIAATSDISSNEDASSVSTTEGGLATMTRRELNEMAISLGIPNPEKFPNKGALAEAIHNFPKE